MKQETLKDQKIIISEKHEKEKKFWFEKFSGNPPKSSFPYNNKKRTGTNRTFEKVTFHMEGDLLAKLKAISNQSDYKLHIILMTGLVLLVHKHLFDGNDDILLGTPIYKPDTDGDFINTVLPLRVPVNIDATFKEMLNTVGRGVAEASENQNYPLDLLFEQLNLPVSVDQLPILDVMLLLTSIHDSKHAASVRSNTIFSFSMNGSALEGEVRYNPALYERAGIERLTGHFIYLIKNALVDLDQKVSHLEVISPEEQGHLLEDFNKAPAAAVGDTITAGDYPVHRLFERQVEKNPHSIAVKVPVPGVNGPLPGAVGTGTESITYGELNEKSNQLARFLAARGVKPGTFVATAVETCIEVIVGMLAIFKAGGVCLPVSPVGPQESNARVVEENRVKLLLTRKRLEETAVDLMRSFADENIIFLDDEATYSGESSDLNLDIPAGNAAFINYSSGTTGLPKGILMDHRSITHLAAGLESAVYKDYTGILNVALVTLFMSALSLKQVFGSLMMGHTLHLFPTTMEPEGNDLCEFYKRNNIDISDGAPIHIRLLSRCPDPVIWNLPVKHFIIGGEVLTLHTVEAFFSRFGTDAPKIANIYGSAEGGDVSTVYHVSRENINLFDHIPLGKPFPDVEIYILGKEDRLQPVGTPGELCIAGKGLSRGYHNDPGLTAEKFTLYRPVPGEAPLRIYRTGDLARWLPDGNVEFLGRFDGLSDVEHQLQKHHDVKECVLMTGRYDEQQDELLFAYIVSDKEINAAELKSYLTERFPAHKVPDRFVKMERLPLTSNFKIDRKHWLVPHLETVQEIIAPRNKIEAKLLTLWADVLEMEESKISVDANFLELNGNSLRTIMLISKIFKEFEVRVPLAQVFQQPTIIGLAQYIRSAEETKYYTIDPAEKKEYYPLTSSQKRLYFIQQMYPESIVYNLTMARALDSRFDKDKIEHTFRQMIRRYEILRTSFTMSGDEPVQRVLDAADVVFNIEYHDIANEEKRPDDTEIVQRIVRPIDLSQPPLFRVGLVKVGENEYFLILDKHHIIMDAVSFNVFFGDFFSLFEGKEPEPVKLHYKDYAEWQNSDRMKEVAAGQKEFWLKEFDGDIPVLNIPTDYVRSDIQSSEGSSIDFMIKDDTFDQLRVFANNEEVTSFVLFLSFFNILLSNLSGQEDIVVGTGTAGRGHQDLEKILGMFVNTLALRNYPVGNVTFREFVGDVKKRTLDVFDNQDYQFEDLVETLPLEVDVSRNPLFDVMIVGQDIPVSEGDKAALQFTPLKYRNRTTMYDLTFVFRESENGINMTFEYSTSLFKEEAIETLIRFFKNIVSFALTQPDRTLKEIEIMTEEEKKQVLYEFNDTAKDYPASKTIHQLFDLQVERTPNNTAVYSMEHSEPGTLASLSYEELNKKSNQLARLLRQKGVGADSIVGLMVERSVGMIIGMMGILKAGGAYLPIDPRYPGGRVNYMLRDLGDPALVTCGSLANNVDSAIPVILLDDAGTFRGDAANPDHINRPGDLAYVIFTSGTTGRPKGTMIEHKSLVNLCYWHNRYFEVTEKDNATQYAGFVFDASVWETFPYLVKGASIHIVGEEIKLDIGRLDNYFRQNNITVSFMPPQFCQQFMEEVKDNSSLRLLLTGGDKLNRFVKRDYRFYNNYGPTENTVVTCSFPVENQLENIPIGKPTDNVRVYILNENNMKVQPVGIPGELCIAGDGISRGYLNRPELTNEKFVKGHLSLVNREKEGTTNDQCPMTNDRLYKTGDLVRWLPDGNIEFLGRIDSQVKLRGFRIELEEIQWLLQEHEKIREAVVMAREAPEPGSREAGEVEKYLCAYIVPNIDKDLTEEPPPDDQPSLPAELKEYLSQSLPDYMIPAYFVELETIPLTANGKIDRRALPVPGKKKSKQYIAPRNETEEKLTRLWMQVLQVEKIGIDDSFFDMGGNSVKIISVTKRINEEFGTNIPVVKLFRFTTIREIGQYLKTAAVMEDLIAEKDTVVDDNLVILKRGTPGADNVFFIHAITGEVEGYIEFCNLLDSKFNYWGVRFHQPDNFAPQSITIHQLAALYLEKIKRVQPVGPYSICGWSFGSIIAFEMIRQLEQENESIRFFAIIDAEAPNESALSSVTEFNVETELERIRQFLPGIGIEEKVAGITDVDRLWPVVLEYLEEIDYDVELIKKSLPQLIVAALPNFAGLDLRELIYYLNLLRTFENARNGYIPESKVNTTAHFFGSSRPMEGINLDQETFKEFTGNNIRQWNQFTTRPPRFYEITGDHYSIFAKPDVVEAAKRFNHIIGSNS